MSRNEVQPACFDTCDAWPLITAELDGLIEAEASKVASAHVQERLLNQQEHESDRASLPLTLERDAQFSADMESARIGAVSVSLERRAAGCTGSPCALARYCVGRTIAEELREPTIK